MKYSGKPPAGISPAAMACSGGFILPHTKKTARDIPVELKILGSGLLAQSGINQKHLKYRQLSELKEKPTTYFRCKKYQQSFSVFPYGNCKHNKLYPSMQVTGP